MTNITKLGLALFGIGLLAFIFGSESAGKVAGSLGIVIAINGVATNSPKK